MAKPAARILALEVLLAAGAATVVARSFWLQVVHHQTWVAKEEDQREKDRVLPAPRGRIFDRNGEPLALSEAQFRIRVSLNQVRDPARLAARIASLPGVKSTAVAAQFRRDFPYFYGPFDAEEVERLRAEPGVHLDSLYNRVYPMDSLAGPLLGRLRPDGSAGIEGMEKALDTLMRGTDGRQHYFVDGKGSQIAAPGPPLAVPVAGDDVELTIDNGLQGIAESALRRQVALEQALGGDVVIVDVHTGELLAVASLRTDSASHKQVPTSSAIVEPNQPGSTSKLFTVAALLRSGADTTPVEIDGGTWVQQVGRKTTRTIHDVHALHGKVTLGETVKYSSNIGITKFSEDLSPIQQYTAIRDFGFGTLPGLGFPGETPGLLHRPARWVNVALSKGSLAQGYEWEASSVQIAMGYAAIANGGTLLAPALLRSVRDASGAMIWEHHVDTVRQAVPDSIARHLFEYLTMTEGDGGTGSAAQLDRFPVPGKTGTAQIDKSGKHYRGSYVGIFPADHPQVVVYVMIVQPMAGKFYGGDVAAPVVRQVLQQALLASTSPLDRRWLSESVAVAPSIAPTAPVPPPVVRVAVPAAVRAPVGEPVVIPAVAGETLRDAIVTLQRAGLRVRVVGRSAVRGTTPAAGDTIAHGATVELHADSLP